MVSEISSVSSFLQQFDVSEHRGFLPVSDPLQHLPTYYQAWESAASSLSKFLAKGEVRKQIESIELLDINRLEDSREQELAFLILAMLAHSYLNAEQEKVSHIPEAIAVPWVKLATQMRRPPIIKHVNMVLNNWRKIDPSKPMELNNLRTLFGFHKSGDEEAFFLITVLVEQAGAAAIAAATRAWIGAKAGEIEEAKQGLMDLIPAVIEMTAVLEQMYDHCDPEVFYHQIRPFFDSFHEVQYQGISENPVRSYYGGSAAQSSLPPVLDAILGVSHQSPYLQEMRAYMPYQHAALIEHLEQTRPLLQLCQSESELEKLRQAALEELVLFRNAHLKIVAHYILGPAGRSGQNSTGTGGTNPSIFLKDIRNDTQNAKNP